MGHTPDEQRNLDLVLGMFANVLEPMDSSAVDRFIDVDYVQHNPMVAPGREALKAFLDHIKRQSPEAAHDIKRAFVDDDHLIVHYNVRRWPGDKGFAVIDVFRVENGLIKEHWDVLQDVVTGGPNSNSQF